MQKLSIMHSRSMQMRCLTNELFNDCSYLGGVSNISSRRNSVILFRFSKSSSYNNNKDKKIRISSASIIQTHLYFSSSSSYSSTSPCSCRIPSSSSSSIFRGLVSVSAGSIMTEEKNNTCGDEIIFDSETASTLVKDLRENFLSGKTKSYEWRVEQLKGILKMVDENEQEILDSLRIDLSKPQLEAFVSEISLTKSACKVALKELKKWMKPEKVGTSLTTFPSKAEIVSEPLGVILIISAWNYPFLLSLDPVIGAIAAGNSLVLKPSEISPATSSLLKRFAEKYLDSSAIRVIEGAVPETSALLEQKWDKILYTGNGRVGRIILAAAAKHLTPVVLELGGKSPVVVDSNIDLKVATRRIVAGKWGCNNGQACIAPDYIITTKSFAPKLIDAFKCTLEEFFGENQLESKDISRIVNSNHFARLEKLLDEDKVSDKIVLGGKRDKTNLKIAPTILLDVPEDSMIMNEEIFGPLLPIVTVDKVEDSFDIIRSRSKPLAAYLFTNDKKLEKEFVNSISAGGMLINDTTLHLTVHTLPFGGVGESGTGAYHGKFSFDTFSHKKGVLYRGFQGDASARYPPYTPRKQRLLKALLNGDILGVILALIGWSKS